MVEDDAEQLDRRVGSWELGVGKLVGIMGGG